MSGLLLRAIRRPASPVGDMEDEALFLEFAAGLRRDPFGPRRAEGESWRPSGVPMLRQTILKITRALQRDLHVKTEPRLLAPRPNAPPFCDSTMDLIR